MTHKVIRNDNFRKKFGDVSAGRCEARTLAHREITLTPSLCSSPLILLSGVRGVKDRDLERTFHLKFHHS
jgi:hypothetical protein